MEQLSVNRKAAGSKQADRKGSGRGRKLKMEAELQFLNKLEKFDTNS